MFGQVYAHKTKRCFEGIAKMALQFLAEKGMFSYPTTKQLGNDDAIEKFAKLDDAWLLRKIGEISEPGFSHWNKAIETRNPFKRILDSDELSFKMKNKNKEYNGSSYLKGIIEDLEFQLGEDSGELRREEVRREHILLDRGGFLSYKLQPYTKPLANKGENDEKDPILIYNYKTNTSEPIETKSKVIEALGEKVNLTRVYVHEPQRKSLEKYLFDRHPDLRPKK